MIYVYKINCVLEGKMCKSCLMIKIMDGLYKNSKCILIKYNK